MVRMTSLRLTGSHTITGPMGRVGLYAGAGVAFVVAVVLAAVGAGEATGALTDWQALVLGVVQGLTEFLPISSSGHLILVPWLADWTYLEANDEFNQTFDVALHLGTLVAAVLYFRREIGELVAGVRRERAARSIRDPPSASPGSSRSRRCRPVRRRIGRALIADHLGEPWQIAILLGGFAMLLWVADRGPPTGAGDDVVQGRDRDRGRADARARAGRLAFGRHDHGRALSPPRSRLGRAVLVPAPDPGDLGAVVYKGVSDVLLADLPPGSTGPFVVGTLAAAASGIFAIGALLGYVRRHTYTVFVVYRLIVAAIVLLLIETGVRSAGGVLAGGGGRPGP